ncbi:unnamed protein product [Gulo gulo]|uniref:Uncharacterized protein n=1 Tax=Gulo gulo TaxID=48420 RepID=A0A9X9Q3J4_GULGU|nr:unnamed protein product [Gulo gulo]
MLPLGLAFPQRPKNWSKRLIFLPWGPRGAPWSPGSWWETVLAAGFLDSSISALASSPLFFSAQHPVSWSRPISEALV